MPNLTTFLGFWPVRDEIAAFSPIELEQGRPSDASSKRLRATLLSYDGPGWRMLICEDYLCLLHLAALEPGLRKERSQAADPAGHDFIAGSRAAWPRYLEALNAWFFLLFVSTSTGRNHQVLHDFAELSLWSCTRAIYDDGGALVRQAHYGRTSGSALRRQGRVFFSKAPTTHSLDHRIFADAAAYWGTVFKNGMVSDTALGAKLIAEHRLENYSAVVALGWFRLEAWVFQSAKRFGFPRKVLRANGKKGNRTVAEMIDLFPVGTTIGNMRDDLHRVRQTRNRVAHRNQAAGPGASEEAISCYARMFMAESGIRLTIRPGRTPGFGMA